jgi:hypothetical protein
VRLPPPHRLGRWVLLLSVAAVLLRVLLALAG